METLNGEKVILGPESVMDGTLTADEIIISGKFKGKIKGKSIRLDAELLLMLRLLMKFLQLKMDLQLMG